MLTIGGKTWLTTSRISPGSRLPRYVESAAGVLIVALFALIVLVLWLPCVVLIFAKFSMQKAIVLSFVTAWLFLPPTTIPLPGFPDWTKMSATVFSVMLCASIKYPQKLLSVRLRFYDIPVLVFCLCPFISAIVNNQGAYDGLSAILDEFYRWGLPYLIGRAFLADISGNRQMCLGMAWGGILYIPFCLYEIRMSPVFKVYLYGFRTPSFVEIGLRYGGYRPMVFLSSGLELGWWMCCASFTTFMLWKSGAVTKIFRFPISYYVLPISFVTLMCKATGATVQILVGLIMVYLCRYVKSSLLLWTIILVGPLYCVTRPSGFFTGEQLVSLAKSVFGEDRAQSLEFRFQQENLLFQSALQRPVFGWARNGGFNPPDRYGKILVTDGLWILVLGYSGSVGLLFFNLSLLSPTALFLRRFRPSTWFEPEIAPIMVLAVILPLFMIDNLSNAMLNPIYAIAMGCISGCMPPPKRLRGTGPDEKVSAARSPIPRLHAAPATSSNSWAEALEAQAVAADRAGQINLAISLLHQSVDSRQTGLSNFPGFIDLDHLALSRVFLARLLAKTGLIAEAIAEREHAQESWDQAQKAHPAEILFQHDYLANLNDLAWLLLNESLIDDPRIRRSVLLASQAVQGEPENSVFWNTLGIAHFRQTDYFQSLQALIKSVGLEPNGGTAFDFYYLAMANQRLGYESPALEWYNRAEYWVEQNPSSSTIIRSVQQEAYQVLLNS